MMPTGWLYEDVPESEPHLCYRCCGVIPDGEPTATITVTVDPGDMENGPRLETHEGVPIHAGCAWFIELRRATPAGQFFYTTHNPSGGSFGSNNRGTLATAERIAAANIPVGSTYRIENRIGDDLVWAKWKVKGAPKRTARNDGPKELKDLLRF